MPRKILIVDDNAMNRLLLQNTLRREYDILEAANGVEALEVIKREYQTLAAVLLDIRMPKMDGYEVLRRVRDNVQMAQLPVIVVTGSEDEESRVKALFLGANDFILKPFNPEIVQHCVKNTIALRETEATLQAIQRDKLTGLYNREAFYEKVSAMVAEREPGYYILSCFDIDNFKLINDQYGAVEGDRILREIGRVVKADMAALHGAAGRISADNFAVLLPYEHRDMSITRLIRENRKAFSEKQAIVFSVGRYVVTDLTLPASALYDRAYIAKRSIKGRYDKHIAYFDDAMLDKLIRDQQIIADMDAAIAEHQFEVWFQPQRNHATGALVGAEALVRWRHPQKGLIPPGDFIPIFEQNGFVYELDKYVWEDSCRHLRKWLDDGDAAPLSVNVSRYDLFRPDFVDTIAKLVQKYRIPAEMLRLEITESAFAQSTALIVDVVKQLIEKGFTIEIDDFGSGYSSLNVLKSVPAQVLKLDMRFLEADDGSERLGNILESIVRMAKWMGMSVIAEGVEGKEQADYLTSIGCSYIQGYYYARPMAAADYENYRRGIGKEDQLLSMNAVANLDNNAFWDPKSMDTLIFNSYVGAACIFEYYNRNIDLLRVNAKFTAILGDGMLSVDEVLKLDWIACLSPEGLTTVREVLRKSGETGEEYTREYVFSSIPGAPAKVYLRATMRVIATAGERQLVYCTCENITPQRKAERVLLETDEQLRFLNAMSHELLAQPDAEVGVYAALQRLMEYFKADRAYISEFDPDGAAASFTYEVCGVNVNADKENRQHMPMARLDALVRSMERDGYYAVESADALGDDRAVEREMMRSRRVSSLLVLPLKRDGKLIGTIGVDDPRRPLAHIDHLLSLGDYISVMLTRRDLNARISSDNKTLTSMMSDMPGGFVRMRVEADGKLTPVYFNEGFANLTGMEGEKLKALYIGHVLAGVHPDDVAIATDALAKMLKDGKAHSSRYRLRHENGGYVWLTTFGRVTRGPSGETYLNTYYTDATEQMLEEEAQKSLLDNLPGGAALYEYDDGALRVIHSNKRYWELVSRASSADGCQPVIESVHPDDRGGLMRELASATSQGRDAAMDIRLRYGEAGYRPFHAVGRILPQADGRFIINALYTPISEETMSIQEMLPVALQSVMNYSSEISFVKGKDLRYISASRKFAQLAGMDGEMGMAGKTTFDVFPPELAVRYDANDRTVLESGKPLVDFEATFPTPEGTRHLISSKYPLLDANGNVLGIYGTGRDVTEARENKSRLELLANNIPGGIAVYAGNPAAPERIRLSYFSDGLCRLLGYERDEFARLMNINPFSLIHSADIAQMRQAVVHMIRDGNPIDLIYRARAKDESLKWLNVKAVISEPEGDEITANAVFFDVTEQKTALEKLRVSEEINRLAILQSKDVVCQYDVATKLLTVPSNTNPIFDTAPVEEDVPYKPVREGLLSPDTANAYIDFYESILRGSKSGEARFQRRSSIGWRWLEAHFTTIFSDSGEPVTAVISLFDITENIEKETAYQKWRQSFRDRAPEAYSLYRCNVSRGTVLDATEGLLIEKTPYASAANMDERTASYAKKCVLKDDRERFLAFMDRSALLSRFGQGRRTDGLEYREKLPEGGSRWLRLTVDYVDLPYSSDVEAYMLFENIDAAKRAELDILERAEMDPLTGVLNRTVFAAKVERSIKQRKPDTLSALFIIDLDGFKLVNDHFGHAVGDETLIEMGQKLRDTFRGRDLVCRLGGDEFMVYMEDVSHISAVTERASLVCALLHKSFSIEVQLSASVGISICPDNGADFETLYRKADLALYHVKEMGKDGHALYMEDMGEKTAWPEKEPGEAKAPAGAAYAAPKRRMLIVEDNELNRDFLTALFEDEFIIDTAAEGTAALTRLRRYGSGISVVLLDLMMPGLDGFAVLKKMHESIAMQSIPVIVVSGMDERETCLKAIRNGAADFITKPVDAELLKLRVASAISKAENEHLRAQNRYLAMQNEEAKRLADAKRHSEELSVALHAAERADLAKSQFLSSMSHEIRTPLNAVIGFNTIARSEMAASQTDEERKQSSMKVLDCLTKSEIASKHLLTIINDVLDMSAIESGKMKVEHIPFDFRGLITSLTVMFFSQARAKGVSFEVLFDKPVEEWFVGDQMRINQILTNLLSNAVKFTPEGGSVTLTITETPLDESSTGFRFVVSDTGIGMTQEYLAHIWTPFEQAEASISRRFGGTGLGLSITKNLVELMNGTIDVESESGVGSAFTVNLTLARTEQPAKPADYDFSHVNALVADDDVSTCDYIKLLFDRCGASCMAFTSGRKAVAAFEAAKEQGKPFNLCLIDWRMPEMDGFQTIEEIHRVAAKDLPIVVVTAYDFTEVSDQAAKLGINRFISKPLFQSSLFDLLATMGGSQPALTAEKNHAFDFDGARVLLVEDNNMNMEVAKRILLSAKCAVDSAWNGQEAFDIFTAARPGTYQAILMDVHMPGVDGYQATKLIRASGRPDAQTIPIIAMTADVFAEDIAEARSAGMNDHIAKPIDVDCLFRLLSSYIKGGKPA